MVTEVLLVFSGCSEVGKEKKQAQDELWEAESWPSLLLWQKHHPQDVGETLRLPLCLWLKKPARVHAWRAPRHVGCEARYGRVKAQKWTRMQKFRSHADFGEECGLNCKKQHTFGGTKMFWFFYSMVSLWSLSASIIHLLDQWFWFFFLSRHKRQMYYNRCIWGVCCTCACDLWWFCVRAQGDASPMFCFSSTIGRPFGQRQKVWDYFEIHFKEGSNR